MIKRILSRLATIFIVLTLFACGGGGGGQALVDNSPKAELSGSVTFPDFSTAAQKSVLAEVTEADRVVVQAFALDGTALSEEVPATLDSGVTKQTTKSSSLVVSSNRYIYKIINIPHGKDCLIRAKRISGVRVQELRKLVVKKDLEENNGANQHISTVSETTVILVSKKLEVELGTNNVKGKIEELSQRISVEINPRIMENLIESASSLVDSARTQHNTGGATVEELKNAADLLNLLKIVEVSLHQALPPVKVINGEIKIEITVVVIAIDGKVTEETRKSEEAVIIIVQATIRIDIPTTVAAVAKLGVAGTLPAGGAIYAIQATLTLPEGVTLKTNAEGKPAFGVIYYAGGVSQTGALQEVNYIPSSAGMPAKLKVGLISTSGFGAGELLAVSCDVASGKTVSAGQFTLSEVKITDENGVVIPGLSGVVKAELR